MIRGLRKTLAATALLLFLVVISFWVRSFWIEDQFWLKTYAHPKSAHQHDYQLQISRGRITVACIRRVSWLEGDEPWFVWNSEPAEFGWFGEFDRVGRKTMLGFGAIAFDRGRGGTQSGDEEKDREWDILFPTWFVALLLGALAAFWLFGVWKRTRGVRRDRLGLCVRCGYDLRATENRCPECGREITPPGKVAQSTWGRESRPMIAACTILVVVSAGVYFGGKWHLGNNWRAWAYDQHILKANEAARSASNAEALLQALCDGATFTPEEAGELMLQSIDSGEPEYAMAHMQAGARLDLQGDRALPDAIEKGYLSPRFFALAVELVKRGANVNAARGSSIPRPPLIIAADRCGRMEDLDLPRILLEKGADPNAREKEWDMTPLNQVASRKGEENDVAFAELLLAHGAQLNAKSQGITAYGWASNADDSWNKSALTEFLKAKGGKE